MSQNTSEVIDTIRYRYRLAKTAEDTRNRLFQGTAAFVRTHVSGWHPAATEKERKARAAAATRVVKRVLVELRPRNDSGKPICPLPETLSGLADPGELDEKIYSLSREIIIDLAGPWWNFERERHANRRAAEKLVLELPIAAFAERVLGFGLWGLVALVGEAGDIGNYPGCRHLFKRLGLAPNECYPVGEKKTGRKIPRATRGRIMGIIAESLLRQQWQKGEARGPFGTVYFEVKERQLANGKTKAHADKLARRAMVKALIHDVHHAWHGLPLDYA